MLLFLVRECRQHRRNRIETHLWLFGGVALGTALVLGAVLLAL